MNIFQLWKLLQNQRQLFRKICLSELDFPHIEAADPGYLVMLVDHGGGLPLGLGQHNVSEIAAGRDHADLLEVVVSHLVASTITSATNLKHEHQYVFGRYVDAWNQARHLC